MCSNPTTKKGGRRHVSRPYWGRGCPREKGRLDWPLPACCDDRHLLGFAAASLGPLANYRPLPRAAGVKPRRSIQRAHRDTSSKYPLGETLGVGNLHSQHYGDENKARVMPVPFRCRNVKNANENVTWVEICLPRTCEVKSTIT